MPKLNRDKLFKRAFEDFIYDNYYLRDCKLENTTKNIKNSYHEYEFIIPKRIIDYTIDNSYIDNDGVKHSSIDEIFNVQEIPNIDEFINIFVNHFDEYKLIENNKLVSYIDIENYEITTEGDFKLNIVVKYFKSHIPYPSNKPSIKNIVERNAILENENKELINKNELLQASYDNISIRNEHLEKSNEWFSNREKILERQKRLITKKMNDTISKMEEKIKDLYNKLGNEYKEDCPVCLEKISTDALTVPYCCHYICLECFIHCDKCPLCREFYLHCFI